jgi:large subunit ribosomal protein L21
MRADTCRSGRCFPVLEEAVFAVVSTGGKQYRVEEGRVIKIDRIAGEPGETVELGNVLLMGDGDDLTVGTPTVEGARIVGTIAEQGRARKIVVFKYKSKTRARKKTGHRQHFTRIRVEDILAAGQQPKPKQVKAEPAVEEEAPTKPKRGRRARADATAVTEPEAAVSPETQVPEPVATAEASEASVEAPEAAPEAPAEKPKRSRKKAE